MTLDEFVEKVVVAHRKQIPGQCQVSGEKFTEANTPDGVHGYEIRVVHPDIPGKSIEVSVCKKVYLDWYKLKYPKSALPKI